MKKLLLVAAAALLSLPPAFAQRIYVRIGPPPVVVEHPGHRPHPGWVWVDGFHRWDGARYVWVSGHWAEPPYRHAVWVRGHWVHAPAAGTGWKATGAASALPAPIRGFGTPSMHTFGGNAVSLLPSHSGPGGHTLTYSQRNLTSQNEGPLAATLRKHFFSLLRMLRCRPPGERTEWMEFPRGWIPCEL